MKPIHGVESTGPAVSPAAAPEHLGRGARAIAEALGRASGKSTDEILSMRDHGHGFGRIARDLGLDFAVVRGGRAAPTAPAPSTVPALPGASGSVPPVVDTSM